MRDETRKPSDPAKLRDDTVSFFHSRFGLGKELFEGYGFNLGPKEKIYLGPKKVPGNPKIVSMGLLIARVSGSVKPTTNLLQLFGKQVTKNFIILPKEQVPSFLKGEDLQLDKSAIGHATDGYVLVRYLDYPLGCGFLKGKTMKNMLPKAKRLGLKYI